RLESPAAVTFGTMVNPNEYQFICRDIYGVRFFLNAKVNRGGGYFLTGKWVDAKGEHGVCGIYNENAKTVSLTLDYRDSRKIMSQYTYSGGNRFAGVECNNSSNSLYELSLYMEKGAFPGIHEAAGMVINKPVQSGAERFIAASSVH
ncbi:MAG: hypothetical protein ACYC9O_15795, partial [Candidatus Latescibacterota bacterium]